MTVSTLITSIAAKMPHSLVSQDIVDFIFSTTLNLNFTLTL